VSPLVYVAGPITGNPWGCVRLAADAFTWLRQLNLCPFLPQLSVLHEMVEPRGYDEWLSYDLDVIDHCHGLVRLPGESTGADREYEHARELGLPCLWLPKGLVVDPIPLSFRRFALDCHDVAAEP